MAFRKLRIFARGPGPIVFLVVLLLTTLKLMSDATQNSARFGELYRLGGRIDGEQIANRVLILRAIQAM